LDSGKRLHLSKGGKWKKEKEVFHKV
jgi:hypothetical protein